MSVEWEFFGPQFSRRNLQHAAKSRWLEVRTERAREQGHGCQPEGSTGISALRTCLVLVNSGLQRQWQRDSRRDSLTRP